MLDNSKAFGSFSVKDINEAKNFYSNTLGLKVETEKMGSGGEKTEIIEIHFENGTQMMIYPKEDHVPATFTVLNFQVSDIDKEVRDLKAKGIKFEHYEGNDENEINRTDGVEIAWFKDPSGNFLSMVQEY